MQYWKKLTYFYCFLTYVIFDSVSTYIMTDLDFIQETNSFVSYFGIHESLLMMILLKLAVFYFILVLEFYFSDYNSSNYYVNFIYNYFLVFFLTVVSTFILVNNSLFLCAHPKLMYVCSLLY